jgi:hypothetical protein
MNNDTLNPPFGGKGGKNTTKVKNKPLFSKDV